MRPQLEISALEIHLASHACSALHFMNTRLIIKNVPKHIKDSDFKAHFAKFGTITDAKIMRLPDGRSRQFGFIG